MGGELTTRAMMPNAGNVGYAATRGPSVTAGQPRRRWALPVAIGAVVALHLGLLAYFAPPRLMFSSEPVLVADFALHVYQVDRALGAFRGWGKLWAYDPRVLAGQPAGVVEDLTSKGTELFVILMNKLGVHPGLGSTCSSAVTWGCRFSAGHRTAVSAQSNRKHGVLCLGADVVFRFVPAWSGG